MFVIISIIKTAADQDSASESLSQGTPSGTICASSSCSGVHGLDTLITLSFALHGIQFYVCETSFINTGYTVSFT